MASRRKKQQPMTNGFGRAVKNARMQAGLSQVELAERMGTDQANIARLEGGKGNPTIKTLCKVGEATGLLTSITLVPRRLPARLKAS